MRALISIFIGLAIWAAGNFQETAQAAEKRAASGLANMPGPAQAGRIVGGKGVRDADAGGRQATTAQPLSVMDCTGIGGKLVVDKSCIIPLKCVTVNSVGVVKSACIDEIK